MGGVEFVGEPAQVMIFKVIDVLIKGGCGVPENTHVNSKFLSRREIAPGSI
jgi:hypothetical protein